MTNATAYVFRVRATNRIGDGAWSDASASVTPDALAAKVTGVSGKAGATSVVVTWSAPTAPTGAPVTGYDVQYKTSVAASWSDWTRTASSATSRSETVTSLTNATAYVFRVRATNRIGDGAWSDASASVTPDALAAKVTGVSGKAGVTSVVVTWSAPTAPTGAPVTGYDVQYKTSAAASWSDWTRTATSATSRSETVTSLTNATAYVFRVRATNRIGDGAWSRRVSASVTPDALASEGDGGVGQGGRDVGGGDVVGADGADGRAGDGL